MSFIHAKEKSRAQEVAQQVNERLRRDDLSPVPEIYQLWFTYYTRSKPEIVRALDLLLEIKRKLTDQECLEIYERYLGDLKNEETVRRAGEQIQSTISEVSGMVKDVQHAASDYNQSLADVSVQISSAKTAGEIETAIQSATSKTKSMIEQNQKLEAELAHTTQLMAELKRDLEFVRREAMTDSLTGLANRKSFDEEIRLLIGDAHQSRKLFTLLMVDIDHFKSFNDNFGHQVGDQVLRLVARTLRDGLKGRDFAARYGGEEFAILLPETSLQSALAVGNSLRQAIAMKDVINRTSGDILGRITMSVGVAEYAYEQDPEDVIERADAALYIAKHNGRNQVVAAPPPVS